MNRIAAILLLGVLLSCESIPPNQPPLDTVNWKTFIHPEQGYSIQYPSIYSVKVEERSVFFRFKGYPVMVIRYLESIDDQSPMEDLQIFEDENPTIEGDNWTRYTFNHHDAIYFSRNIAFIKPHKNQFITVQFRVNKELDPVHKGILKSFKSN